jgi:hypothetical protein
LTYGPLYASGGQELEALASLQLRLESAGAFCFSDCFSEVNMVRLPGVFWLALIEFATEWLPHIVDAPWVPRALLLLLALAKAIEIIVVQSSDVVMLSKKQKAFHRKKLAQWLIG